SSQGNILEQNQKNVLKTSQTNVSKPKENNIPDSSQENVPNSNKKKILKHKANQIVKCSAKVTKRIQTSYSILQKLEVVNYVVQYRRNIAAVNFNFDATFYSEAEKCLYMWIIKQRKQALAVTYKIIQNRMMEILQQPDMVALYNNSAKTFKILHRWTVAFMKRNKLALRQRTKISQKLPKQTQELLEKFYEHIAQLKSQKFFELGNILNIDETSVWFDIASNFTVNLKGKKTVHICAMVKSNIRSQSYMKYVVRPLEPRSEE
ncbi:38214_t:CDS:2, partial [Gigaspora margarita]